MAPCGSGWDGEGAAGAGAVGCCPVPRAAPRGAPSWGTFGGFWVENSRCLSCSPCVRKALFARINKFLWFMPCTKLGLSGDFCFQAIAKVQIFVSLLMAGGLEPDDL